NTATAISLFKAQGKMNSFSDVSDDLMENIVSRMPALSFASSACVNKSWNKVCTRSLSSPKLASALSLNPSLHEAVKEVFDKVLAKPINPHFIISCIGNHFNLELAHQLVDFDVELQDQNVGGLVLVVGFVPGLKVDAIPLFRPRMDSVETFYCNQSDVTEQALVDKFITNIKMYNASVSDSEAPSLIILFGDDSINVKPIVARLDMEMPEETVIVGDTSSRFMCRRTSAEEGDSVVALVFARDRCRKPGVGEIEFHMALSEGIMPFGPILETVSVVRVCFHYSSILAGIKGTEQFIHGQGLVENMHQLLDGGFHDLYIGVIEESGGESSNSTRKSTLTLYPVLGGDREYLVIKGNGIKKGDTLLLYHSDSETASATSQRVDDQLLSNFLGGGHQKKKKKTKMVGEKVQVFGGLVFSSYDRKQRFPGSECLDVSPFISNFPGVPVAGFFCIGEIARGPILPNFIQDDDVDGGKGKGVSFNDGNGDELSSCSARGYIQYYSTVSLAMAYLPAPPHSDD
ncbi:F-box/LRR-repeat protein At5g63520, partial [Linum perenne]